MRGHIHRMAGRRAPPVTFVGETAATGTLTLGVHANTLSGDWGAFCTSHNGGTNIVPGTGTELQGPASANSQTTLTVKQTSGSGDSIVYSGPASILRLRSFIFSRMRLGSFAAWSNNADATATSATISALAVYWPNSTIVICGCARKATQTFVGSFTHDGTLVEVSTSNTSHSSYFAYLTNTSKFGGGTISWDGTSLEHKFAVGVFR